MALIELPHTRGCLVCGHDNPHGLHLHLNVDEESGTVTCDFVPAIHHIGFEGIIHGGVLSTVLDEAMVWAATWSGKRFCVCGELNVRFRQSVAVGKPVRVMAKLSAVRSRLIETEGTITDLSGKILVESTGKYVPLSPQRNREFVATLVPERGTVRTFQAFNDGLGA
jgi:uncharacterized protein (TIGR00369 family)